MTPNREKQLQRLQNESFDILVIGGGATGCGIALDAATRGYKVALVEAGDFASGTSSRSTKLIHGGVRYLESAFKNLDLNELKLVKHSLSERSIFLQIAPHLTRILPIFIPCETYWEKFYYGMGMKIYDLMSGSHNLKSSHFTEGGVIYYDGQFDDARMNVSLALTAAQQGAAIANYVSVVGLEGKTAVVEEKFTGKKWKIQANLIINATGPFTDQIRQLDDPKAEKIIKASIGTHILLDRKFDIGILIPKTSDGRVLFILPWEESTLIGTTDIPGTVSFDPKPSEEEIEYLLNHVNKYLKITKADIKSSWSGIRPLIKEKHTDQTANLSRDYKIIVSKSGLYSITGGKWTCYRLMGEDLLDTAITNGALPFKSKCVTKTTKLIGAQKALPQITGLDEDIIAHLLHAYGDRAEDVLKEGGSNRLVPNYPYIEAEVIYAMKHEYACTEMDILSRRLRLFTQDQAAAETALPRVKELMKS